MDETMMNDDEDFDVMDVCECELDWRCPKHRGLPTPEDLIATTWSFERNERERQEAGWY